MQIPDFAHYLTGWRVWRVQQHWTDLPAVRMKPLKAIPTPETTIEWEQTVVRTLRARLRSMVMEQLWPERAIMQARCEWHQGVAPARHCSCGLYAAKTLPALAVVLRQVFDERLTDWQRTLAVGRVALWGQVVEHEHGWRAEFGRPLEVWVLDEARASVLAEAYGVPVRLARNFVIQTVRWPMVGGPSSPHTVAVQMSIEADPPVREAAVFDWNNRMKMGGAGGLGAPREEGDTYT